MPEPSPDDLTRRAKGLFGLRRWFHSKGYAEVQSPVLVSSPAMEEHLQAFQVGSRFLRTSPEFALKRAIATGLPRVYEIGPCFRREEWGPWHNSEFTMVEWYRVGATLGDLMDEVQEIVSTVAHTLGTSSPKQWRRTTVREVFREATGLDIAHASAQDISAEDSGWDDAFFRRWVADVEPTLLTPTFVSEWPASQAALSTVRDDGEWPFAERFEVYLNGIELANAFHELIDAKEQRRRCAMANAVRQAEGNAPYPIDTAFVDAVGRMPPTSGIALGFDRLIAALSGWEGIQRGCFPQDRPT